MFCISYMRIYGTGTQEEAISTAILPIMGFCYRGRNLIVLAPDEIDATRGQESALDPKDARTSCGLAEKERASCSSPG
jgi:hypothetical protein